MPFVKYAVQVTLLLLVVAGFYGTWYLLYNNGAADMMLHIRDFGPHTLPGTDAPLKRSFTGFGAVDTQLTILTLVFWEIVDGSMPNASLHAFYFAGQVAAAWGLFMVESMRAGNRSRLVSFVMIFGLLLQNLGYAVIMPLYLILHLSTSPTILPLKETIAMENTELACIPLSIILGYVVPSALVALPSPSLLSFEGKQSLLALWQVFPLWVAILQQLLTYMLGKSAVAAEKVNRNNMGVLRFVYTFLISAAGTSQIVTGAMMLTSISFPTLFAPEFPGPFDPSKVAIPTAVTSSVKATSIGEGTHLLLQYDQMVGSTAILVWAWFLFVNASSRDKVPAYLANPTLRSILLLVMTGPVGCAVSLVWARDELVYSQTNLDDKKGL